MLQNQTCHYGSFRVTEKNVPFGYLLNTESKDVTLSYVNQDTEVIYGSITITNKEPTGTLEITKQDILIGNSASVDGSYKHGDASIAGATYKLYARDTITNVARTITYFNKGDEIATFTFNERGIATIKITNTNTEADLKVNGTKLEGIPMGRIRIRGIHSAYWIHKG